METVSIIVPCFNEAHRIKKFLKDMISAFSEDKRCSLIIVDDGSGSADYESVEQLVKEMGKEYPGVRLHLFRQEKNRGKGAAVEFGISKTRSDIVGFVDADGSVSAESCKTIIDCLRAEPSLDGVIGSRIRMLGKAVTRSAFRHYSGRTFATFVSAVFGISTVYDTQCGGKFFRRKQITDLLPLCTDKRWVWDTQLLLLMIQAKRNILELPIDWHDVKGSKISLFTDPLRMAWSLLRFRFTSFAYFKKMS